MCFSKREKVQKFTYFSTRRLGATTSRLPSRTTPAPGLLDIIFHALWPLKPFDSCMYPWYMYPRCVYPWCIFACMMHVSFDHLWCTDARMMHASSDHLDACMMHDPDTCLYARCMNPWCGRNFVTNKPTDKAILIQGFWLDLEPSRQNQILPAQPTSLTYLPPDPPKTWPPYTPDLYLPTWSSHQTYPLILSTWHFYLIYPPAITFGKGQFRNFGDVYPVCIIGVHDVSSVGGRD